MPCCGERSLAETWRGPPCLGQPMRDYAGWMVLAEGVALSLLRPEAGYFTFQFFRYPLLFVFVGQAVAVTLVPASGILLPLGFLHRNIRRVHLRNVLLAIFVVMGCLMY